MKHAIDIVVPVGTKVYAAREGVVTDIDTDKDGNKSIELEHSDGAITDYSHLSKFLVKEGQNVKEGETIAQSGSSGDLGGLPPHLHFEVDEPDSESNYYTGYHSVPFEWKRAPQTETRIVELKYNQEFYSRAVKKRHVWNSDTALRDPYSEHETINDG